jgi:hypothetical protein
MYCFQNFTYIKHLNLQQRRYDAEPQSPDVWVGDKHDQMTAAVCHKTQLKFCRQGFQFLVAHCIFAYS